MAPSSSGGIVIAHSSDLHVDDGYTASLYGGDGTLALRCVLEAAAEAGADIVLLTGDIFEHNRLPEAVLFRTRDILADIGVPVVMLPGNHDPAIQGSAWHRGGIGDPGNVHVLGVTHEEAVLFPEFDLEIWGVAHRDYFDMAPLEAARPRSTAWQVAAAHGHYEPAPDRSARHKPSWLISDAEIAATAADYVALGHWNRPLQVGCGAVPAYYSGSPDLAETINIIRLGPPDGVAVERHRVRLPDPA